MLVNKIKNRIGWLCSNYQAAAAAKPEEFVTYRRMEHEDFSESQFSAIWESMSADECCRSGSSTFLPELCSPENNSWLSSQNTSISGGFLFGEDYTLMVSSSQDQVHSSYMNDRLLVPISESQKLLVNKQEHQKIMDLTNPDSPCSPLLFNFLPQSFEDQAQNVYQPPPYEQSTAIASKELPYTALSNTREGDCRKLVLYHSKSGDDGIPKPSPSSSAATTSGVARIKQEYSATEQDDDCPFPKRSCLERRDSSKTAEIVGDAETTKSLMPLPEGTSTVLGHALNTDGKPRAKRGSASDPQSVYARHRRERINERLRALQSLVPNGAKVDIVTMLEEAINYVKFLQLQVKLLSSDEYWTYAPTSYNGMNISLGMHIGMQSFISQT